VDNIVFREDPLAGLKTASTYQEKLAVVHDVLKKRCTGIDRVSIALYDGKTKSLATFIASPSAESPLKNYEFILSEESSLQKIASDATPRIVNDLRIYEGYDSTHSQAISGHGFASSYTHPMYQNKELAGFVFLNSFHNHYFRERVLEQVEIFIHLISELILNDLAAARALVAAMRTSISMVQKHDLETGAHLERMSRYSRLIARSLVRQGTEALDDEQIEQIALFSPLHDVGKIGIPDRILQKPAKLDLEEREVMNTHTMVGRQIVDDLIVNFGFEQLPYIDYLRHIAELHHEAMDGSGYPHGLCGEEISLAARITAVSDIFDALTTQRPYKEPWSNEHAFAMLQLLSIDKLDKGCVDALISVSSDVREIQKQFAELN
jgi:HD-GYP domain-containing protein (c-di-GMP phosphodiesterase class II)